jgi:predicted MFS family arabinose efflux permease
MHPILALAAAAFLSNLMMRMTDPVVPLLVDEFKVPAADLAQLATAYALPYALFQLVFGPLGDRFGKVVVVRWAVLALAGFIALTGLAPSFSTMLGARVLSGAVGGAIIPLGLASIGDRYAIAERQVVLSRFMIAVITGQMVGALLTGTLAAYMPWRWVFYGYGVLALGVAAMLFTVPAGPNPEAGLSFGAILARYRSILARPMPRVLVATVFAEGALFFATLAFLPPYLAEMRGYGPNDIGLVMAAYGIGAVLFSLVVRQLISTLGPYGMIASSGIVGGAVIALFTLDAPLPAYAALSTVLGFAFYLAHNNMQTRATEMAPEARGSGVALFACALFLGNGFGPLVMNPVVHAVGYRPAYWMLAGALVVFGFVAARVIARPRAAA